MTNLDIQGIKDAGHRVLQAKVAGVTCTYRSLSRAEFRDLQKKIADKTEEIKKSVAQDQVEAKLNFLKEDGEEQIVMKALLVPKIASELELSRLPAGLIPTLSELIMSASGFGAETEPQEL